MIQTLIIIDPQSNIPGLIVLPTIVRDVQSIALEGGSHLGRFEVGWSLHYRDTLDDPNFNTKEIVDYEYKSRQQKISKKYTAFLDT